MRSNQPLLCFAIATTAALVFGLASVMPNTAFAQALEPGAQGVISIRALAERQRKAEQVEFLNKLSGQSSNNQLAPPPASEPILSFQPDNTIAPDFGQANSALQALIETPPLARNTIVAIYGPAEKLTMEVADGRGGLEYYKVGDRWANHRIVALDQNGAQLEALAAPRNRLRVPLGGQP